MDMVRGPCISIVGTITGHFGSCQAYYRMLSFWLIVYWLWRLIRASLVVFSGSPTFSGGCLLGMRFRVWVVLKDPGGVARLVNNQLQNVMLVILFDAATKFLWVWNYQVTWHCTDSYITLCFFP